MKLIKNKQKKRFDSNTIKIEYRMYEPEKYYKYM